MKFGLLAGFQQAKRVLQTACRERRSQTIVFHFRIPLSPPQFSPRPATKGCTWGRSSDGAGGIGDPAAPAGGPGDALLPAAAGKRWSGSLSPPGSCPARSHRTAPFHPPVFGEEGEFQIENIFILAVPPTIKPLPRSLEIAEICLNSTCGLYIPC